ncbi:regulatory LuxR family protein [Krasilnikovia cinnamomea]|uniref:Regulatory LuxR family protein n=1 Tax=Krasilnikovia cinnamomea TaxID=349313 RepID=A0A4Q7ZQF6_9ACTN|nr:LuxR family transcriptional regulator [Krasilnikovia cinnamomea]RZU53348.1 regulatory LuxR family protein [Krasilnikovia cinnamomea]
MQTRAPFIIGRNAQLDTIERALTEARTGTGSAVFLVGEPGIGKSRLALAAAERAAAAGMHVLRGRGSTVGPTVPFRPLTEALLSQFRGRPLPQDRELAPYRPVLGRLMPEWGHPGGQYGDSLIVLAEAVLRLLAALGRDAGCLLVLEDLQDADAETLAVVEYLVDNAAGQPIVLLAAVSAEPSEARDLAHSATRRHTGRVLELPPLDRDEVHRLVAAALDTERDGVPDPVARQLWEHSAGNPFIVEELLHAMVDNGVLVGGATRWRVAGELRTDVPATLVRGVAHRIDRLGPSGRTLLSAAATLGYRFPLSVVHRMLGTAEEATHARVQAAIEAQLVVPDEPAPDWFAFRHPTTARALLAQLTPMDRAQLSRRAADVIESLHPGLPGPWCPMVAALRQAAGDPAEAARRYTQAGRRALDDGAAGSAVTLLERARELAADGGDPSARADTLEALLPALAESGAFERALQLGEAPDELGWAGLDAHRRAALHTRLAKVAHLAGRWPDGIAQISKARLLLGDEGTDEDTAPVDTVAAFLALDSPSPGRIEIAADLARRAVVAAERVPLPQVACQAWELLGTLARGRDLAESDLCFERAIRLAEQHRLPISRIYALVRLGGNRCLADGDTSGLRRAGQEALRVGAITAGLTVDAILAMQSVLTGEFESAGRQLAEVERSTSRLQLLSILRYVLVVRATLAAHRADRAEMAQALDEFKRWDGEHSPELPLAVGLARVFCALLEEDTHQLDRELATAAEIDRENPSAFHLSGRHGLYLLLDVLAGRAGWPELNEVAGVAAGQMRWNRHFVELARAVLLGRDGNVPAADAAAAAAQVAAEPFPTARHLGLRLVAEEANRCGWGDAEGWLRRAEEHFHRAGVPAVASACRGLLRQIGASVQQRRAGADRVPAALRALSVTVREYEVFELLAERLNNRAIGTRLHISPRTVEKHVASLIIKTDRPGRAALVEYAAAQRRHRRSPAD